MNTMVERRSVPRPAEDLFVKLASSIRRNEFTPFLGAGASALREANKIAQPWTQVLDNIIAIIPHLKTKETQHFISSFAAQRLGIPGGGLEEELLNASMQGAPTDEDSVFHKNGLVRLQAELINATVRLTQYFGSVFSDETPPLRELASCSVPFDPADLNGADAVKQLLKAAAIAQDLQGEPPNKRESPFLRSYKTAARSLEIMRIHEKLLILVVTLLGDKRDLYGTDLERHRFGERLPIPDEVDRGDISDYGRLRFDALQWMSELIWYTLRYWIPCYPTTTELAFELSLRVPKAPPRRPELAQAAQALENEYAASRQGSLTEDMANIIRYCERYQDEESGSVLGVSAFYSAIAMALCYQFELYKEQARRAEEEADEPDDDAGDRPSGQPTIPLVFTTNFDNALERVFDKHGIGYHVAYPTISDSSRKEVVPVQWRVKTCYPECQQKEPAYFDFWTGDPQPPKAARPGHLVGPIILKLHGAPCIKDNRVGFKHWLVLSETGYLEALATASHVPEWVRNQLGGQNIFSHRALWFLGYSMSDWNVRLRLFEHCRSGMQSFRGTVDREGDVYRRALLLTEKIHVEQWYADLSLLPQRILELFARDQTRDLTAGVDGVAEFARGLQAVLRELDEMRRRA